MQCLRLQHGPREKKWKTAWNDVVIYSVGRSTEYNRYSPSIDLERVYAVLKPFFDRSLYNTYIILVFIFDVKKNVVKGYCRFLRLAVRQSYGSVVPSRLRWQRRTRRRRPRGLLCSSKILLQIRRARPAHRRLQDRARVQRRRRGEGIVQRARPRWHVEDRRVRRRQGKRF